MEGQWSQWIEWKGEECPIEDGVLHEVYILGYGNHLSSKASLRLWNKIGEIGDIERYRYQVGK